MYLAHCSKLNIGRNSISGLVRELVAWKKRGRKLGKKVRVSGEGEGEIELGTWEIIVRVGNYRGVYDLDGRVIVENRIKV